ARTFPAALPVGLGTRYSILRAFNCPNSLSANLQAHLSRVKERRVLKDSDSCTRPAHPLKVRMHRIRSRMAHPMWKAACQFPKMVSWLALSLVFALTPLSAQLVGADQPPPTAKQGAFEEQPPPRTAAGKRVSRDFTLKGDSHWTDTKIEVQPGEHVLVTVTG